MLSELTANHEISSFQKNFNRHKINIEIKKLKFKAGKIFSHDTKMIELALKSIAIEF